MSRVKLNVGGKLFETTIETLSASQYFAAFFERWNKEDNNEIFIDRDSDAFGHVLGILRDPNYSFPRKYLYELEFFGIEVNFEEEDTTLVSLVYKHFNDKIPDHKISDFWHNNIQQGVTNGAILTLIANDTTVNNKIRKYSPPTSTWLWTNKEKKPYDYTCNAASETLPLMPLQGLDYPLRFIFTRRSDLISTPILFFKISGIEEIDKALRFEIIEKIQFISGSTHILTINSQQLYMYSQLHESPTTRAFNERCDKTGEICIDIPVHFMPFAHKQNPLKRLKYALPIYLLMDAHIDVYFKSSKAYKPEHTQLYLDHVYFNTPERDFLVEHRSVYDIDQFQYLEVPIPADDNETFTFDLRLKLPVTEYWFCLEKNDEKHVHLPIKRVVITANGIIILDVLERMILDKMVKLNIFPDSNIYYWEYLGSSINFSRIEANMTIFLPKKRPVCTFKLTAKNKNLLVIDPAMAGCILEFVG